MQQEISGHETRADDRRAAERLFHRDLPGGGYVAIELSAANESEVRIVRLIVERRFDRNRRIGHPPPVIHEESWTPSRGLGDLYRIACDNVAIARGLLRLPPAD